MNYRVIGTFEDIVGLQYKDFQIAIGEEGLSLAYRGELNNRIKIL